MCSGLELVMINVGCLSLPLSHQSSLTIVSDSVLYRGQRPTKNLTSIAMAKEKVN
jgi:hypothetical protein